MKFNDAHYGLLSYHIQFFFFFLVYIVQTYCSHSVAAMDWTGLDNMTRKLTKYKQTCTGNPQHILGANNESVMIAKILPIYLG